MCTLISCWNALKLLWRTADSFLKINQLKYQYILSVNRIDSLSTSFKKIPQRECKTEKNINNDILDIYAQFQKTS